MRNHNIERIKANLIMGGIILGIALLWWVISRFLQ